MDDLPVSIHSQPNWNARANPQDMIACMLTYDERHHFSQHGWLLQRAVFSADECARYRDELDELVRHRLHDPDSTPGKMVLANQIFHHQVFLDWFQKTAIVEANGQLLGTGLRYQGANAHIRQPDPTRLDSAATLRQVDLYGWHRGMRPKFGTHVDDADSRLINCSFMNNITYLTPCGLLDGPTAVLDGSHLIEGSYETLKERCPLVYIEAEAGDVLIFTETLLHSATPILSERTRYTMFYGFVPPWWCCWPGMDMPGELRETIADERTRSLLGPPHYGGQFPEGALTASSTFSDAKAEVPA
jgi:hypothetical protein